MSPYRTAAALPPCPRCTGRLTPLVVLDATLSRCERCAGVFVPTALLARLDPLDLGGEILETFPAGKPAPDQAVRYLRCPFDRELMHRRLVAGARVIVDECHVHGVWFDAHELRTLVVQREAAAARGAHDAPALLFAPPSGGHVVETVPPSKTPLLDILRNLLGL